MKRIHDKWGQILKAVLAEVEEPDYNGYEYGDSLDSELVSKLYKRDKELLRSNTLDRYDEMEYVESIFLDSDIVITSLRQLRHETGKQEHWVVYGQGVKDGVTWIAWDFVPCTAHISFVILDLGDEFIVEHFNINEELNYARSVA